MKEKIWHISIPEILVKIIKYLFLPCDFFERNSLTTNTKIFFELLRFHKKDLSGCL